YHPFLVVRCWSPVDQDGITRLQCCPRNLSDRVERRSGFYFVGRGTSACRDQEYERYQEQPTFHIDRASLMGSGEEAALRPLYIRNSQSLSYFSRLTPVSR